MTLTTSNVRTKEAKRGEVWWVNLDPTIGDEIKKKRRCIIISSDTVRGLEVRLVVPITGWKPNYGVMIWCVPIDPSVKNGLTKKSVADVLQTKCVSIERFTTKAGCISAELLEEVIAALAVVIEYV